MKTLKESVRVWGRIFKRPNYILLTFIVAFIFYLLNGLIINIPNIKISYQVFGLVGGSSFLFKLSLRIFDNVTIFNTVGVIILSFLVGFLVSILVYRFKVATKSQSKKAGFLGGVGVFLGAAAPGCAACGVGIISLIGLSSALAILPFNGKEVIVVAIVAVAFSVISISKKLYAPTCAIKLPKEK
jgi:hypothetical protein